MSLENTSIRQHCKALRLAVIEAQFAALAAEAQQQNHLQVHYLEALLQAEVEDRERRSVHLRLKDAHLPRLKTLEEFDFAQWPQITDQAHIMETGSESYRFRRTLKKKRKSDPEGVRTVP